MISPFYGINPAQAENPLFFLYLFQDLNDVIMSYKFRGSLFWKDKIMERKKSTNGVLEAKGEAPCGPCTWPHGTTPFRPRGPNWIDPSPPSILMT